jgi:hypothetical protein
MRGEASLIEVASCMLMMVVAGPSFNTPDPYDNKICGPMNNAIHFTIQTRKPIS